MSEFNSINQNNDEYINDIDTFSENVLVLLSAYNGEKYILEQLESIRNQVGIKVFCLIRDDGSKDNTMNIIREYCNYNQNFKYYSGNNLGVVGSFNDLVCCKEVNNFKWIAFSDQDDFWEPDKLQTGINNLKSLSPEQLRKPCLYFCNLFVSDQDLNILHLLYPFFFNKEYMNLYTPIVNNVAYGCTEVFNYKAVELYRKGVSGYIEMHDYWLYLICIYLGNIIYDKNAYIKYRQHNSNVVGAKQKHIIKVIKNIIHSKENKRQLMFMNFLQNFEDELSDDAITAIKPLIEYQKSFTNKLILLTPRYKNFQKKVTMNFKLRVLLNRIY
jgi:glycosyltransferase involved in cell wall biosynthesis